ncbi:MAG TPA: hypothetical protein PLZ24_16510 [Flavobacteriales bacterium]|nr:hypothetical protein [Flavobacteriales bacterium]
MTSNIDPLPANQRREEPTTNDPQAGYEPAEEGKVTHEYELTMKVIDIGAEQRPLLSYRDMIAILDEEAEDNGVNDETQDGKLQWSGMTMGGIVLREFYEAKITSGELMVVKTVKPQWNFENDPEGKWGTWECECFRRWDSNNTPDVGEFCNCGARIIE